ncbi:Clavaminate synthase-like protein [Meredithblackwellia eburnea MCA 4105]
MADALELPVLDLSGVHDEFELGRQFALAGEQTGFLQIVNHGVSSELIDRGFALAEKFFQLPLEEKVALRRDPVTSRGYLLIGSQALEGSLGTEHEGAHLVNKAAAALKTGDQKEGFTMGVETPKGHKNYGRHAHGDNRLPSEDRLPGIKAFADEYTAEILKLQHRMMRIVARSLDQDPETGFTAEAARDAILLYRFLHYPATQPADVPGIGAHTDFGFTTLLATSGEPGLEVYYKGGWHAVEPVKGAYIVNIGDCLSRVTGGRFKSSLHRVMNHSNRPRYSLPCFLEGNPDFVLRPLGTDPSSTEKFETVMDVLHGRHVETYGPPEAQQK